MPKVIKGVALAAAIYFTAGTAAFIAPGAFATMQVWNIASAMALSAVLGGVSAQLAASRIPRRVETVEYSGGPTEPRRIIYGKRLASGTHLLPPSTCVPS